MMNRLTAYLTAAMFAAHAVLGCCWHHAHDCGREESASISHALLEAARSHAGLCERHDSAGDAVGLSEFVFKCGGIRISHHCGDRHSGNDHCKGAACVFVRRNAESLSCDWIGLPLHCLAPSHHPCPSADIHRREQCPATLDDLFSPTPLHLASEVLLI